MIPFAVDPDPTDPDARAPSHGAGRGTAGRRREALIRAHWAEVRRFLRVLGADAPTADDLAQDAFVIALRKGVAERDDRDGVRAFLRATARNVFLASLRRRRPHSLADVEAVWTEEEATVDARRDALRDCMDRLTERVQRGLHLAYGERRSRAEVAAALGIRPGGVKSLMRRARHTLKECVERALRDGRTAARTAEDCDERTR